MTGSLEKVLAELKLGAPRGPIRPKYELFRWAGEPGWPQRYQEIWAIGDVGTGKTSALIDAIFFSLYNYPGSRVAILRSTLVELQSALIPDLQARLRPLFASGFLEYNKAENIIRAANGSEAHLFGLDTADNKLWGQQWFRAFVDQGERIRPEMLDLLHTRVRLQVRHKDTGQKGATYVKLTANWDRGRDWVYKRVEDGARPVAEGVPDLVEKVVRRVVAGRTVEAHTLAIYSRTHENHELDENYFRHLALGGRLGERATRGGYDRGEDEGMVFVEYSNRNITDLIPDLYERAVYVGLDHGVHHPTVAIFFVRDLDGVFYSVREYARRNASVQANAEALADILWAMAEQGAVRFHIYADPAMWQRQAAHADLLSVVEIYQSILGELDVPVYIAPAYGRRARNRNLRAPQGSIEHGIAAIKYLLARGLLMVNPRLTPKLDRMLAELTYDHIQSDAMELVDFFDAARYVLANARMEEPSFSEEKAGEALKPHPFTLVY